MNLFRSEEHIRNWARFDPATSEGILPLQDIHRVFSGTMFRRRLDPDYVTRCGEYFQEFVGEMAAIAKTRPFWSPPGA
jgi:hypothetical protein